MKEWQRGFSKEELVRWEEKFASFNEKCISPFLTMRTRSLADSLHNMEIQSFDGLNFRYRQTTKPSPIKIYTKQKFLLSVREVGDLVIDRIAMLGEKGRGSLTKFLRSCKASTWVFIHEEDSHIKSILSQLNFERVGANFNSFGDIQAVYYSHKGEDIFFDKSHHTVPKYEQAVASRFKDILFEVSDIQEKLAELNFLKHYSNYNIRGGWSAISLRGYLSDPMFIIKPSEMKEKWHLENQDKDFYLQDTPLIKEINLQEIFKKINANKDNLHRIRLMKLSAGAVIERHTDQVDPDIGVDVGTVPRLHIPITTNDKCVFQVWGLHGMKEFHMRQGELWYLDTRKPHRVVNNGEDRIHLVIDILADDWLVGKIKNSELIL